MFDGSEYIFGNEAFPGGGEISFYAPEFSGTQKKNGQNQSIRPIETQLETFLFVLYYLNRVTGFILTLLLSKVFAMTLLSPECCLNV